MPSYTQIMVCMYTIKMSVGKILLHFQTYELPIFEAIQFRQEIEGYQIMLS